MAGVLRLRVEEIAPNDKVADSQAAELATLVALARGFTLPLADNTANNGLKELLKTAEITTEKRNRVVLTATLTHSLFSAPAASQNAPSASPNPPAGSPASPGAAR
jgi:hypothetical protein